MFILLYTIHCTIIQEFHFLMLIKLFKGLDQEPNGDTTAK